MTKKTGIACGILVLALVSLLVSEFPFWIETGDSGETAGNEKSSNDGLGRDPEGDAISEKPQESLSESVQDLWNSVLAARDGASAKEALARLRENLSKSENSESLVIALWNSSADSYLNSDFSLGRNGQLLSASSSRAMLLSLLAEYAPEFALSEARGLLENTESAEVHSIAMQTVSRLTENLGSQDSLYSAINYHLTEENWLAAPSNGYLQGFDLAVAHPSSEQVSILLTLESSGEDGSVSYAARLVLDRWGEQDYVWTIEEITTSPVFWEVDFRLRAQTFARANPRSELELDLLVGHLENPKTSLEEAQRTLSLYPLISNHVSTNLVTVSRAPNHNDAKETVALASEWLREFAENTSRPELVATITKRADHLSQ
ncbi:MAG: hypothetical protein AAF212_11635 [Verrucomicrobiota bacterium]